MSEAGMSPQHSGGSVDRELPQAAVGRTVGIVVDTQTFLLIRNALHSITLSVLFACTF